MTPATPLARLLAQPAGSGAGAVLRALDKHDAPPALYPADLLEALDAGLPVPEGGDFARGHAHAIAQVRRVLAYGAGGDVTGGEG